MKLTKITTAEINGVPALYQEPGWTSAFHSTSLENDDEAFLYAIDPEGEFALTFTAYFCNRTGHLEGVEVDLENGKAWFTAKTFIDHGGDDYRLEDLNAEAGQ